MRPSHGDPWGRPCWGRSRAAVELSGVRIGMRRDHDERYNSRLRDLITTGRARPSTIVSHRLALDQAPEAFRRFDERRDGYLKAILSPNGR
jgi:glutathione-independent formaldehyde dehydrogenase